MKKSENKSKHQSITFLFLSNTDTVQVFVITIANCWELDSFYFCHILAIILCEEVTWIWSSWPDGKYTANFRVHINCYFYSFWISQKCSVPFETLQESNWKYIRQNVEHWFSSLFPSLPFPEMKMWLFSHNLLFWYSSQGKYAVWKGYSL